MAELRRFAEFVGDLPVGEVKREDVRAFRDHRGETLRASTLNIKVMSRLVSFFRHCQEEGWVTKLPTNRLRVRDPISNRDKRRTFTLAELQRVFGPGWSRYCDGDDHKYHCGRLLLATGARAEEIAHGVEELQRLGQRLNGPCIHQAMGRGAPTVSGPGDGPQTDYDGQQEPHTGRRSLANRRTKEQNERLPHRRMKKTF